jgi:hypothetical protein
VLAACYRGSLASLQTLGPRPGSRVERIGRDRHSGWRSEPSAHCKPTSKVSICTRALRSPRTKLVAKLDWRSSCGTAPGRRSQTTAQASAAMGASFCDSRHPGRMERPISSTSRSTSWPSLLHSFLGHIKTWFYSTACLRRALSYAREWWRMDGPVTSQRAQP